VPLILKVNDHDVMSHERDPNQALTSSVADALIVESMFVVDVTLR